MATSIASRRGVSIRDNDDSVASHRGVVIQDDAAAAPGGRVMSSLAKAGGLVAKGGIAGKGGGLAGS